MAQTDENSASPLRRVGFIGRHLRNLAELVEVPPDYLKFDINLIRDIQNASAERQGMLESLVRINGYSAARESLRIGGILKSSACSFAKAE